jgi:hypothetical protein
VWEWHRRRWSLLRRSLRRSMRSLQSFRCCRVLHAGVRRASRWSSGLWWVGRLCRVLRWSERGNLHVPGCQCDLRRRGLRRPERTGYVARVRRRGELRRKRDALWSLSLWWLSLPNIMWERQRLYRRGVLPWRGLHQRFRDRSIVRPPRPVPKRGLRQRRLLLERKLSRVPELRGGWRRVCGRCLAKQYGLFSRCLSEWCVRLSNWTKTLWFHLYRRGGVLHRHRLWRCRCLPGEGVQHHDPCLRSRQC